MDRQLQLVLREVPEHGDILVQRVVEEKYVLADEAHDVVEAVGGDLPELPAVDGDGAGVAVIGPHEEVQQGALSGAGGAHQGVLLPGLQGHGQILQHRFLRLIAEGDVFQGDGVLQLRGDGGPGAARVLLRDLGQLFHQCGGGLAGGPILGDAADGVDQIAGQIHEHDHRTAGDVPPDGEVRANEKKAELEDQAKGTGQAAYASFKIPAAALRVLHRLVGAVEKLLHFLLSLEAFDDCKTAEEVLDPGHKSLIPVADIPGPLRHRLTSEEGERDRWQAQSHSKRRQHGAVPEHHPQCPQSQQRIGRQVKNILQIVCLNGGHIVGESG